MVSVEIRHFVTFLSSFYIHSRLPDGERVFEMRDVQADLSSPVESKSWKPNMGYYMGKIWLLSDHLKAKVVSCVK